MIVSHALKTVAALLLVLVVLRKAISVSLPVWTGGLRTGSCRWAIRLNKRIRSASYRRWRAGRCNTICKFALRAKSTHAHVMCCV